MPYKTYFYIFEESNFTAKEMYYNMLSQLIRYTIVILILNEE